MKAGACSFRLALCSGSRMSGKACKGEWVLARQWGEGSGRPLVEGWLSSCFRETWELRLRAVAASARTPINPDSQHPPPPRQAAGDRRGRGSLFLPHLSGSVFSVSRLLTNVYTFLLDTTYQSKIRTQFLKKSYAKKYTFFPIPSHPPLRTAGNCCFGVHCSRTFFTPVPKYFYLENSYS